MTRLNLNHIAGYCTEKAIWAMVRDVSAAMPPARKVGPEAVGIEDAHFVIDTCVTDTSEKDAVWHIGALICYLSSGRMPFGGRGAEWHRKNPDAKLPSLKAEHQRLSSMMKLCLDSNAEKRPTLVTLRQMAEATLQGLTRNSANRPRLANVASEDLATSDINSFWPEEMQ